MEFVTTCRPTWSWLSRGPIAGLVLTLATVLLTNGSLLAQDPSLYDLEIRVDKEIYNPGDAVQATVGVVTREAGIQGWSYGVRHDTALLTIDSLDYDSSDAKAAEDGGFSQNRIIEEDGVNVGFIQAVVLTLAGMAEVPASPDNLFSFVTASYTVSGDACAGQNGNVETSLDFVEDLAVPGSPPVELNLTVGGRAVIPERIVVGQVNIMCEQVGGELALSIDFNDDNNELLADESTTLDVHVLGSASNGSADVQGWSYGVSVDRDAIIPVDAAPGADAAALNGGSGPDVALYDLNDMSNDGSVTGITVGVVVAAAAPANEVLPIGDGETKHLDTITFRSAKTLGAGETEDTTIAFVETLGDIGGRDPIEVLFVLAGEGVSPDSTDTKTITLVGVDGGDVPRFIRGDANNDSRVDISDGIWILVMLFAGGETTACMPAANADSNDEINMSDAMYIFNWRLQPNRTPDNLAPAPGAPFPNCGTAADATLENCPIGSHACTQ